LLDSLGSESAWEEFYAHKLQHAQLSKAEQRQLEEYIQAKAYQPIAAHIQAGGSLPAPTLKCLNKLGGGKRLGYSYGSDTNYVLKLLAHQLYRFDDQQPAGCYSFRRNMSPQQAVRDLVSTPGIDDLWAYKLDIKDYFNSIPIDSLMPVLTKVLAGDPRLLAFFSAMLRAAAGDDAASAPADKRGVFPGTPTAPFLANVYLCELDAYFVGRGVPYARYSDDVIIFAPSREELQGHQDAAASILASHGLTINNSKERISAPGEAWEFLGFSYCRGTIDLAAVTQDKLKGKIRRKARALRRWMLRKEARPEHAMKVMIRVFNRKLFDGGAAHELTWSRWFFPLLTTAQSLQQLDAYLQQYTRWIATGKHSKANYRTTYATLKDLGLRTLVNEYHKWHKELLD
jgi:hypothetical protein